VRAIVKIWARASGDWTTSVNSRTR